MTLKEFIEATRDLPADAELVDDLLRPYESITPTTVGVDIDSKTKQKNKNSFSYGGWYSHATTKVIVLRGGKLTT